VIFLFCIFPNLQKVYRSGISADQQVPKMGCQSCNKMMAVKSMRKDLVEKDEQLWDIVLKNKICRCDIGVVVKDVQVFCNGLSCQVLSAEAHHPVVDRQGVPHGSICFLGNYVKRIIFCRYTFLFCDIGQVILGVGNGDPLEIEDLATRKNGRNYLVFFSGGKDKDRVLWRFLKGFKECVEGSL